MRRTMTLKEWKARVGEALSIPDAAAVLDQRPIDLARAAANGTLNVQRFDASDGKRYYLVRIEDLLAYHRKTQMQQKLTPRMLSRALQRMVAA